MWRRWLRRGQLSHPRYSLAWYEANARPPISFNTTLRGNGIDGNWTFSPRAIHGVSNSVLESSRGAPRNFQEQRRSLYVTEVQRLLVAALENQ
jgi:hypothetical protein